MKFSLSIPIWLYAIYFVYEMFICLKKKLKIEITNTRVFLRAEHSPKSETNTRTHACQVKIVRLLIWNVFYGCMRAFEMSFDLFFGFTLNKPWKLLFQIPY